jgi:hypothetical protein
MEIGMERYSHLYPDSDIVLFEPQHGDGDFFFTNPFSYSSRRRLCEHAYQRTREELWVRRHELIPVFERHGLELNLECLRNPALSLMNRNNQGTPRARSIISNVDNLEDTLEDLERFVKISKTRQTA